MVSSSHGHDLTTDGRHHRVTESFLDKPPRGRQILVVDPNPAVIERHRAILYVEVYLIGADFADFDATTL